MNGILDVHYEADRAITALVRFDRFTDEEPIDILVTTTQINSGYVPGEFYKRELPCLVHAVQASNYFFDTLVIDGYVCLAAPRKGLGHHLFDALDQKTAIIGIAKNPMKLAIHHTPVLRGSSGKPLFISALGMELNEASERVKSMHGPFRLPTLVKLADQAAKGIV
jgi:deoxyinosine 3'endonuclease (endonuclease V)